MNTFDLGCAVLSASTYIRGISDRNQTPSIDGAVRLPGALGYVSDTASGFEASAFTYQGRIVIAYAGTNTDQTPDMLTNGGLALGFGSTRQLTLAAEFYQRIKQTYGADNITFTGHSLGGGLAALMGVFFNKPAVTFDPAPFRLTATQSTALTLRNYLYIPQSPGIFPTRGAFSLDADLTSFTNTEQLLAIANPALYQSVVAIAPVTGVLTYPTNVRGESGIKAYAVRGEFLSDGILTLGPQQMNDLRLKNSSTPEFIGINPVGANLGRFDLHSMALLVIAAQESRLAALFNDNPRLTEALFDKTIYARAGSSTESDFLAKMVQREFGGAAPSTGSGHLAKLANDLTKIDVGVTGLSATARAALAVQAIEWYYWQGDNHPQFLSGDADLLQYTSARGAELAGAQNRASKFVGMWLTPIANDHGEFYFPSFGTAAQWNVSTGAAVTAIALDGTKTQMFIGQGNADTFTGGDKDDVFFTGAGNDSLNGGKGSDRLYGGAGTDTYTFTGAFGGDVVLDSDGAGGIVVTGLGTLSAGNAKKASPTSTTWKSDDKRVSYSVVQVDATHRNLVITVTKDAATDTNVGSITIRNWSDGQLGITLGTEVAAPATTTTYSGDYAKATNAAGDAYLVGADGNYVAAGPSADAADVLNGSNAADWLLGTGGNDGIAGGAGDDLIEGGAGSDLLLGSWGADTLNGGAGNDFIFGSALGSIARPTAVGFTAPASSGVELARGFSWVAYRNPGNRIEGGVATLFSPQVAGASLFPALFENGQFVVEAGGNVIDGGAGDDYISAGTGADIVHGGDDNDDIVGLDGADVLFGDAGADLIWGDGTSDPARAGTDHTFVPAGLHGNDLIVGGAGNDVLLGQGGNDELYGGSEDDWLWGDDFDAEDTPASIHGDDYLDGGDGADKLVGGGSDDVLFGGIGNDRLWGDDADSVVPLADQGIDYLDGEDGDDQLVGGGNDDALIGGVGNDTMLGDDVQANLAVPAHGNDYMDGGDGNDVMAGGGGNDEMLGGVGNDQLQGDDLGGNVDISAHGMDWLDGGAGDDTLIGGGNDDNLFGGDGSDFLRGDDAEANVAAAVHGADWLEGGAGNDTLFGDGGNDTLIGGAGADYLSGDSGDDRYIIVAGETSDGASTDTIHDSKGADTLVLEGVEVSALTFSQPGSAALGISWGVAGQGVLIDQGLTSSVQTIVANGVSASLQQLVGERMSVAVTAGSASVGGQLFGGAIVDVLTATHAANVISGGRGDDQIALNSPLGATVRMSVGDGTDTVSAVRRALPALPGDPVPTNTLELGAGLGGTSVRMFKVGAQAWILAFNDTGDGVRFNAPVGMGVPIAAQDLPFDVIRLNDGSTLTWQQIFDRGVATLPTATNGDDVLLLTPIADSISGLAGNDRIEGLAGNDVLSGGDGNDTLLGGVGNDTLYGEKGSNTLDGGEGDDLLYGGDSFAYDVSEGGEGNDQYYFRFGYQNYVNGAATDRSTTSNDIYRVRATSTVGGGDLDTWTLADYGGTDQLILEASIIGAPTPTVQFDGSMLTLSWWNLRVNFAGLLDASGLPTPARAIEQVRYQNGTVWSTDQLLALTQATTSSADVVHGMGTNDTIDGLGGDDRLYGGYGDDTLLGGAGWDYVYGEAGNDTLEAGPGGGVMDGGAGSDTYVVRTGDGPVSIVSVGEQGYDVLQVAANPDAVTVTVVRSTASEPAVDSLVVHWLDGSADVSLALLGTQPGRVDAVEEIRFANGSSIDVAQFVAAAGPVATAGDDVLQMTSLNDVVFAGDGADVVCGRYGDDWLDGGNGNDSLLGSYGDDRLDGGSGNDSLNGGVGNDLLAGGAGSDTLTGGQGVNTYAFSAGDGHDIAYGDPNGTNTLMLGTGLSTAGVTARWQSSVNFTSLYFQDGSYAGNWARSGSWGGSLLLSMGTAGDDIAASYSGTPFYSLISIASVQDASGAQLSLTALMAMANAATSANDVILDVAGVNALAGGDGDDRIVGLNGPNVLQGQGGNDILSGGDDDDTLVGGVGDDQLSGLHGTNVIRYARGDGNDTVQLGYGGETILEFGAGIAPLDLTVTSDGYRNTARILGGGSIAFNPGVTYPGAGIDDLPVEVRFADGTVWNREQLIAHIFSGTPGNDQISGFDNRNDTIYGGDGNDILNGYGGSDTLDGGAGNDSLYGGARGFSSGVDQLTGGAGNDTLYSGWGAVTYRFDSGFGNDTIAYTVDRTPNTLATIAFGPGIVAADVACSRSRDGLILSLNSGTDTISVEAFFASTDPTLLLLSTRQPVQQVQFADGTVWTAADLVARLVSTVTNAGDEITGTAGADAIDALAGNDYVHAAAGDDQVAGGLGNDQLFGEVGNDSLAGGLGEDRLEGGDDLDHLDGGPGDDMLLGGPGVDWIHFARGDGQDTVLDGNGDTILFAAGIAPADVSYTRSGNHLVVALVGSTDQLTINGFLDGSNQVDMHFDDGAVVSAATIYDALTTIAGSAGADTLIGTQFADRLFGLSGNDMLTGLDGNDRLDGGTGADVMQGGNGDDEYWVDDVVDQVSEQASAGFDVVNSTISYTLPTNVDGVRLLGSAHLNATGNSLNNELVGNDGNNVLNGGSGADWMAGRRGDDAYIVAQASDVVIEELNEGIDTVQSSVTYTLGSHVENLTLTGTSTINGTGNTLNNTLTGNSGANVLTGGLGDDIYVVGAGDSVVENASQGIDLVQSSASYTLGTEIENLTLTGSTAINGTGNALDNVLTGNSAINTLSGGAGNDTYIVGTGDTVTEAAGAGTDTIMASVSWTTLANNVEYLTLTGNNAINGTGNTLANVITGNGAANALNGGTGADTLIGGAGNDSYTVDNTADVITELANEGTDSVSSNVSYTLSANIENLTLTGTSALNGTGNALDNVLTGNSAVNTLAGGAGNDTYFITSGDVVVEASGEGTDTIQAGFTYTLLTNFENLTLTGTSAINATGNAADNLLTGNSAVNTLSGLGGNDTYVITSGDVLAEASGAGTDTVLASFTYTLLTNFENLSLTGSSLINGTGNTADNLLTGNSAANTLSGLAGNDTYAGGAGNDTLTDNSTTSNDIYRWGIGQGNDTINDAGGSADRIEIAAGVVASQVTLTRSGNNLLVGLSGAADVLTVANWYLSAANKIEEIRLADGTVIGSDAAPLSLARLPSATGRMQRLDDSSARAPAPDNTSMLNSAQTLVQAMAQFNAGPATDEPWMAMPHYGAKAYWLMPW